MTAICFTIPHSSVAFGEGHRGCSTTTTIRLAQIVHHVHAILDDVDLQIACVRRGDKRWRVICRLIVIVVVAAIRGGVLVVLMPVPDQSGRSVRPATLVIR